jgi:hypothetical protein
MKTKKKCCFFFLDYVDFDVYLNARIFYHLAGFQVVHEDHIANCSLVVFFRGMPARVYPEYVGPVHFYDYVHEYSIPILDFFPNASSITIISFDIPSKYYSPCAYVYGYLPVIPGLWKFSLPFSSRSPIPVHLANYKPIDSDAYQAILISKIRAGRIRVYGRMWNRVEISARPCSYLSANLLLSKASICYGLMYPYQRGKSLSGRMWQAPIQGCVVLSEANTNLLGSPGILEVDNYENIPFLDFQCPNILAAQAAQFWQDQTSTLARNLNLVLNYDNLRSQIFQARVLLFINHIDFVRNQSIILPIKRINNLSIKSVRSIVRKLFHVFL